VVEVRVYKSLSFHFFIVEEVVGGSEVSLFEGLLSGSVSEEKVGLNASLNVNEVVVEVIVFFIILAQLSH